MGLVDELAGFRLLLDRHQITERLLQYFTNVDRRLWQPVKAIFVPEAVLDYSDLMPIATSASPDEVVDRIAEAIGIYSATVHQMGNCEIAVNGDEAESETWVTAIHVYADPDKNGGRLPVAGLRYADRWVRTDDHGWLVSGRRAVTDWRAWMDPRGPTYVDGTHQ
jgi:hypothetical protein